MENVNNYKTKIKIGKIEIEVEGDKEHTSSEPLRLFDELQKKNIFTKDIFSDAEPKSPFVDGAKSNGQNHFVNLNPGEKPHIKDFIAMKNTGSAYDTTLLLAYYLLKYEGKESFSEEDLKKLWVISGEKPPKAMWQAVIDCKNRKGWYEEVSKGVCKVSPTGIYHVEKEMNLVPQ